MSLILEAINRSARDRQTEPGAATPGLDTPAYPDAMDRHRRWPTYLPWLALLVALVVIAYLAIDEPAGQSSSKDVAMPPNELPVSDSAEEVVATVSEPVSSVEPASAAEPVLTPEPIPVEVPASVPAPISAESLPVEVPASDPAVAALYGNQREDKGEVTSPAATFDIADAGSTTAVLPVSEAVQEPTVTEQPIDIEKVLARTEEELKSSRLQEHPAPFIAALSQRKKDGIPSILYRHHDYSSNASQSSVVLNGKKVKEGQSVTSGIRLDEILPDSIVLSHQGEQFRLRALNSWVNL